MADGFNDARTARVAELLSDFRNIQYYIAAASWEPPHPDDYYTEGWAALRQCCLDGQHILNCAAETRVPRVRGGAEEQSKAELGQVLLDAYSRRHEAQKIYLRQEAAKRWVGYREQVLRGERPHQGHTAKLLACDANLRNELLMITDDGVYADLCSSDFGLGRWIMEDPGLRLVQRWVRARR